jgi:hypothetical protein
MRLSKSNQIIDLTRESREGLPLLVTVETEMNGNSKNSKGSLYPLALHAGTRDFCPALAALVGTVQTIKYFFFLTIHYFNSFVPIAQQAGSPVS